MTLSKVEIQNFTVFKNRIIEFTPGINVLIGENGTGKTHLLKLCYAATNVSLPKMLFVNKVMQVFRPSSGQIGSLASKRAESNTKVEVSSQGRSISIEFTSKTKSAASETNNNWASERIWSAFMPSREMLAIAPGFLSLYSHRSLTIDETHKDILDCAYLPSLRRPLAAPMANLLGQISEIIGGVVENRGEAFVLSQDDSGNKTEVGLMSEGICKLGLLWLLVKNGSIRPGSVLFWDLPENGLHTKLLAKTANILIELQRNGVQIILASHSRDLMSVLLDKSRGSDKVKYHYLDPTVPVA